MMTFVPESRMDKPGATTSVTSFAELFARFASACVAETLSELVMLTAPDPLIVIVAVAPAFKVPEVCRHGAGASAEPALAHGDGSENETIGQRIGKGDPGRRGRSVIRDRNNIGKCRARRNRRWASRAHSHVGRTSHRRGRLNIECPPTIDAAVIAIGVIEYIERPRAIGIQAVQRGEICPVRSRRSRRGEIIARRKIRRVISATRDRRRERQARSRIIEQ